MIEYISMEMGVIRLTGGEVALFHLSQVFLSKVNARPILIAQYERCGSW